MDKKPATKKTTAKAPAKPAAKAAAKSTKTTTASSSSSAAPPSARAAEAPPPQTPKTPKTPKPAAVPLTPKTPKPPQTPKAPQTPKTPKPPQTPKTPKPAAGKAPAAKAAASKPATAKAAPAKPASAKPTSAKPAADAAGASGIVKSTSAKTGLAKSASAKAVAKPASAKATAAKPAADANGAAHDANGTHAPGDKTPKGDKPTGAAPPARPATTGTAKAAAKPAASGLKRPATGVHATSKGKEPAANATAKGQKATTPRDHSTGLPKKSPRQADALKSPRHNTAALSRTNTAPELPVPHDVRPSTISAGSRSVSVGGLQSNITRAAPAGRRKPTTNPLKNRPHSSPMPAREQAAGGRAAAGFFSGMGILAAVGAGADGLAELNGIQLRKVSEEKPKVLLIHVKGRRNVTARATETTHKSLNKGDAFVLIDPSTRRIFEWRGSLSNKMEIAKAMDLAGRIKNKEFSGRAEMFVLEEGKTDNHAGFWELLGGKGTIAPAETVGEDEDEDKQVLPYFLHGVVEKVAGKLELSVLGKHKMSKDLIQTGQVYVVDCLTELYMWVGKGCSNAHRTFVATKAQEHLTHVKGRPKWVAITRVIEGAEPEIFKEKFVDWPSTLPITMAAVPKGNVAAAKANVKFDVNKMFTPPARVDKVVDDGSGKVEIWRVKDHTKEPVDREMYGQFFDSESYVILYTYIQKNREQYIIYFWQGKKSSINEKGSSALLTVDLDDSIGGAAVQVRVVQNKEPLHFMKLFKRRIIVHKAYETEDGASAVPETALYHIRGFNIINGTCDMRAVQCASPSAKYLNTNDIFLLNTPDKQYIWTGAASSKFYQISDEQLNELGSSIKASREQIFIREGEEPNEFWENVGEAEYYKTEWQWLPRLFHCSSASGSFLVEEILEWDQEDLDPGHLNILDTSVEVYLWTGQRASIEEEKKQTMETVLEYTKLHPHRKEINLVSDVLSVSGRREPFAFKSVFIAWDDSKSLDPNGLNDSIKVEDMLKELSRSYSLAELRNPPKMLDSTKLETYLSDEEFETVFKMDKAAFGAQPLWKQEQQKKNVGLY